ncbi:hypothetical protein DFH09DRAFT_951763, partial [Mycena vulgaris]
IVELIGRTDDGRIVFPKLVLAERLALAMAGIGEIKRILLQLAEAVISLHAIELIRCDLALRTILASSDNQTAYLCDLECCYGSSDCAEIADAFTRNLDLSAVPFSENLDVCMFGRLMADCILCNGIAGGNWLPPAPFRSIVLACIAIEPSARPSMQQVKALLEAVPVLAAG